MRLNLIWEAPWLSGPPLEPWLWHHWFRKNGIVSGRSDMGLRILGFTMHLSFDALWSGISFSINVWSRYKTGD